MNQPNTNRLRNSVMELKDAAIAFITPYLKQALTLPLPKLLGWCIVGALLMAILPLALFLFFAFLVGKAIFGAKPKNNDSQAPAQLNHVTVDGSTSGSAREPS